MKKVHLMKKVFLQCTDCKKLTITLAVNESDAQFEVDTGCGVTIMNRSNFAKLWETCS